MLERFRAKPFTGTDLNDIVTNVLPTFASLNAYPDGLKVEAALEQYHAANGKTKREASALPVTNSRQRKMRGEA